jgi:signal transduction histidine kinase
LLAEAVDLVPAADLVAVPETASADPGRMLAGLPVRLVMNVAPVADATLSPTLRLALWIGWGALALATAAAAALLAGVMALSERRAAFVSSVTHELRTPLTTFRMYSEMLARGMVPDASRRQEYLHTLQREAERLTHLVENVLAYARLERGRRPSASERVTPVDFLDRITPRLAARAAHADMQCEIEVADECADVSLTTDPGVVEQILFNLVDNAAKYARTAADRRIHVSARREGRWMKFAVSDHGPGMPPRRSSRLRPFAKTAEESAETAPGVGLGLALCGRLARQLGGRLEIAGSTSGASVTLLLPTDS